MRTGRIVACCVVTSINDLSRDKMSVASFTEYVRLAESNHHEVRKEVHWKDRECLQALDSGRRLRRRIVLASRCIRLDGAPSRDVASDLAIRTWVGLARISVPWGKFAGGWACEHLRYDGADAVWLPETSSLTPRSPQRARLAGRRFRTARLPTRRRPHPTPRAENSGNSCPGAASESSARPRWRESASHTEPAPL